MSERFFEYDQVEIDSSKIEEYKHQIFGPVTVFKDVVIAREIVHGYKDGNAYKPAKELEDSFWTADGMWAIATGHPDTAIIMDRDQMQGRTVNVRFSKSLKDPKTKRPNNRGIVADLEVFNDKVPPEILDDMKSGKRRDVSIGFFFSKDDTPGIIEEDGHPLRGMAYDYVQRKIAINHTAFALEAGRCPMPFCGVGADEITQLVTGDPFAGYKNFADCVKKNQDKEDPDAYCATIMRKVEGKKDMFRDVLENMKNEISMVLSKFDDIEEDAEPRTEAERAMTHFNITEEKWAALSEEEKQEYISKLPKRGEGLKKTDGETIVDENMSTEEDLPGLLAFYRITAENWDSFEEGFRIVLRSLWTERQKVYKDKDPAAMAGGEQPSQDPALTNDDCPDCMDDYDEFMAPHMAEDALTYAQKKALPDEAYAYIEAGCEKEDGKTVQRCRHLPIHDESHVRAALAALGGARTGKVPPYAAKAKPKVCAAAKKFKIESEVCGSKDEEKKPDVKVVPFVATKSVEELLKRRK